MLTRWNFAKMLLWLMLPASLLAQTGINPKTETPTDSFPKMRFLPPKDVKVEVTGDQPKISWTMIPLGRVQGYVVYQKTDNQESWKKIGFTAKSPFLLTAFSSSNEYSVAALDTSGTEGQKSKPVTAQK